MKNYLYVFFFLLLFNSTLFSSIIEFKNEEPNIDSLINQLPKLNLDSNKINLYLEITGKYRRYSEDTIDFIKYAEQALELSKKIEWKKGQAKSLFQLGYFQSEINKDYNKAIEYFQNSIKINKEIDNESIIYAELVSIARAYEGLYEYDKAVEYFKLALKETERVCKKLNIYSPLLFPLYDLYSAYEKVGNYKEAFEVCKRYVEINDRINYSDNNSNFDPMELYRGMELRKKEEEIINKYKDIEKMLSYMMYCGISGLVLIIALAISLIFVLKRVSK